MHSFQIGRDSATSFTFDVQGDGWVRARTSPDGTSQVIGGQSTLRGSVRTDDSWDLTKEATGNNTRISDGVELYAGAGFDASLVEGQAADVLWALGERGIADSGRLLEVGCGPGFLLETLGKQLPGWELVGVDPSPASCRQASDRGVDVRLGTLEEMGDVGTFDAIVVMGNFQLHHDPAHTLRGLSARCRPGGRLFLDAKNPLSAMLVASR